MNKNQPIGILDSGLGGLTVVKEIMKQLPDEELIYVGDTARCPYGPRTKEEVTKFTFEIIDFLMTYNVKSIVIACNTATAYALEDVKNRINIPVVGVIKPGSEAAIRNSERKRIGVIGTIGTISSSAYEKTLKKLDCNSEVIEVACPTLVPLVEGNGNYSEGYIMKVVSEALSPLQGKDIDSLILGCTHYPIISEYIQSIVGNNILLISSAEETAKELASILENKELNSVEKDGFNNKFFTTGDENIFKQIGEKWLGIELNAKHIDLEKHFL